MDQTAASVAGTNYAHDVIEDVCHGCAAKQQHIEAADTAKRDLRPGTFFAVAARPITNPTD